MATIDNQIAELQAAIDTTLPILEGFHDFKRVLKPEDGPEAPVEVQKAIEEFEKRLNGLSSSLEALILLKGNGYPAKVSVILTPVASEVLKAQLRTQALAAAETSTAPEAQTVIVTVTDLV